MQKYIKKIYISCISCSFVSNKYTILKRKMQIFSTKKELQLFLKDLNRTYKIGFSPTMGALHEGHLSLVKQSIKECDVTICSIFVNPTQFNNPKDLAKYPRTLKKDLLQLKKTNCDIVYTPEIKDLYKKDEKAKQFDFGSISQNMEGEYRPGHFNGMATIVKKLFNIVKPSKAFFGEKDLQQLQIVKLLAKQMPVNIEVVGCKTIREKNGLAKSSRNALLSKTEKEKASHIYKMLKYCKNNLQIDFGLLKKHVKEILETKDIKLEYLEFVSLENMQPIQKFSEKNKNAICIAAYLSNVRLIDNIIL